MLPSRDPYYDEPFSLEEMADMGVYLLNNLLYFVLSNYNSLDDIMRDLEAYRDFSPQSTQLNSGVTAGGAENYGEPWARSHPTTDINFTTIIVPNASLLGAMPKPRTNIPPKSIEDVVRLLLSPPPRAFVNGMLSISWVIGVVGYKHFRFRKEDERWVLGQTALLREKGPELGLPMAYFAWLCGDDPQYTATEEGMILTPEFFEKEVD